MREALLQREAFVNRGRRSHAHLWAENSWAGIFFPFKRLLSVENLENTKIHRIVKAALEVAKFWEWRAGRWLMGDAVRRAWVQR